ncbi:hypothetical protein L9F63_010980 [Diploptera punctata]|uniref:Uncharacterized protein n=1 Tax=Diploptera punctata TaxID=6984 RepID=A0AAD8EQR2_DIPPU|nr:hypothetical protein L9F63_010980 [Diploptera punctata]
MKLPLIIHPALLSVIILAVSTNGEQTCPAPCQCKIPWALCKRGKIQDLAGFSNDKVTALSLHEYDIGTLKSDSFSEVMIPIWKLQILKSNLHTIKKNAFKGLEKVEGLDLVHNNIENIEAGAFDGLPHLTTINLQSNNIKVLKPKMFKGLKLSHLHLDHNQLTSLNPTVFENIGLITVRDNPLDCNCYLKMVEITLGNKISGATCNSPENLRNQEWTVLKKLRC